VERNQWRCDIYVQQNRERQDNPKSPATAFSNNQRLDQRAFAVVCFSIVAMLALFPVSLVRQQITQISVISQEISSCQRAQQTLNEA
jgi:hypothetical protein